jgi:hypothetical protein
LTFPSFEHLKQGQIGELPEDIAGEYVRLAGPSKSPVWKQSPPPGGMHPDRV